MPVRYVVGEEEDDKLREMNRKGDVKSLCEDMGENFPKGLWNLHIFSIASPSSNREFFYGK